jgi:phage-related protein
VADGQIGIRVIPDAQKFRADLKKVLERAERTMRLKLDLDLDPARRSLAAFRRTVERDGLTVGVDVDRSASRRSRRQIEDDLGGAPVDVPVGTPTGASLFARRLKSEIDRAARNVEANIPVGLDGDVLRAQLEAKLKEIADHQSVLVPATPEAGAAWRRELQRLRDELEGLNPEVTVNVDADTARARTSLARLARDRVATVNVQVSKSSIAAVSSTLAGLSGMRLMQQKAKALGDTLTNFDKAIPGIALTTTKIAAIGAVSLSSLSGVLSLGTGLLQIGGAGLALPGILAGAAVGMTTLVLAMKDAGTQLGSLAPQFKALRGSVSAAFWEKAKKPILDMVNTVLPAFSTGMTKVSSAIGTQFGSVADTLKSSLGGDVVGPMMDRLANSVKAATPGMQDMLKAFITLGDVGSKYLTPLAKAFSDLMARFNNWVQINAANGNMMDWIDAGIQGLKNLGGVVTGVVRIFSGLNKASQAAGAGNGLAILAATLHSIADVIQGPTFQTALTTLFKGAGAAASSMASALKPIGNMIAVLAPTISTAMQTIGTMIGKLATELAGAFSQPAFAKGLGDLVSGVAKGVEGLLPAIKPLGTMLGTVGSFAGELAGALGGMLGTSMKSLSPVVTQLLNAIKPLIPVLTTVVLDIIEAAVPLIKAMIPVVKSMVPVITQLAQGLMPVVKALLPPLMTLVGALVPILQSLVPVIQPLLAAFTSLATVLASALMPIIQAIVPIIQSLMPVIASVLTALTPLVTLIGQVLTPVIQALLPVVETVFGVIADVIKAAMTIVQGIIQTVTALIKGDWSAVWQGIQKIFSGVWDAIKAVVTGAIKIISSVIKAGLAVIKGVWTTVWGAISSFAKGLWDGIKSLVGGAINGVRTSIGSALGTISKVWNETWANVKKFVGDAWKGITDGVSQGVGKVVEWFRGLWGRITGAMGDLQSKMIGIGTDMIRGFINGIAGMAGKIKEKIQGVIGGAIGWAKDILGIHSPSRVFKEIGNYLGVGFANGITGTAKQVKAATGKMVNLVKDGFDKRADLVKKANAKIASLETKLAGTQTKTTSQSLKNAQRRQVQAQERLAKAQKAAAKNPKSKTAKKELENAKKAASNAKYAVASAKAQLKASNAKVKAKQKDLKVQLKAAKADKKSLQSVDPRVEKVLLAKLAVGTKQLEAIAAKREVVGAKLQDARKALSDLQKEKSDYEGNVFSNLMGLGDPTKMRASADAIIAGMAKARDKILKFGQQIRQLKQLGLNADTIDQIVSAGAEQGAATAEALLKGGTNAINQVNSLQAQMTSASKGVASTAGDALYGAGIQAAQGLVKGLESQEKALIAQATKIANAMAAAVKKALKIHSPSRVFRDEVGVMIARGIIAGTDKEAPALDRAMSALVSVPGVGEASTPSLGAPRVRSATAIHLHTNDPYQGAKEMARLMNLGAQ